MRHHDESAAAGAGAAPRSERGPDEAAAPAAPQVAPAVRASDPGVRDAGAGSGAGSGAGVPGSGAAGRAPEPGLSVPEPGTGASASASASAMVPGEQPAPPPPAELAPSALLPTEERDKWALRLHRAVTGFVDEPRKSVEEADAVLGETAARIAELVKERRRDLSAKGDTEELRLALRECRELTERMLEL
ncbi:hypothetical protein ABZ404_37745 [Streptomyces sp. NPDC005878]|uniref:hypothetical protein n=1 Tax=Streptomyces sp. NPDC005878 TaxID=3157077 RepID=UPI00340BA497